jgi:hypothetical protein
MVPGMYLLGYLKFSAIILLLFIIDKIIIIPKEINKNIND